MKKKTYGGLNMNEDVRLQAAVRLAKQGDSKAYVGSSGAMLINALTPDGYLVDVDGAWVQDEDVKDVLLSKIDEIEAEMKEKEDEFAYNPSFTIVDLNSDGIVGLQLVWNG